MICRVGPEMTRSGRERELRPDPTYDATVTEDMKTW